MSYRGKRKGFDNDALFRGGVSISYQEARTVVHAQRLILVSGSLAELAYSALLFLPFSDI
jgi:hypothetical protein